MRLQSKPVGSEARLALKRLLVAASGVLRRRSPIALGHDGGDDFLGQFGLFHQRLPGGVLALADQFALELQPRAFFLHHAVDNADVEDAAFLVDAVVVDDLELGLGKGRRDLVLDDLDLDVRCRWPRRRRP